MQAIILAAGMGKRLGRLTRHSTKCMVELNGKRLVDYCVEQLESQGIRDIVFVVGFGEDELKSHVRSRFGHLRLEFISNKDYATTNNIYSLLLAKDALTRADSLIIESDLIFAPGILHDCLTHPEPNCAVVAKYESWMDGTVVLLDDDGFVKSFIPKQDFDWSQSSTYYKTVNIYKVSKEFSQRSFVPFLEAYISARGVNQYYEEVLRVLSFVGSQKLKAVETNDHEWYEVDDLQDLDIAGAMFASRGTKLDRISGRFGGYWRFQKLKDFCYLVNPYFPSPRLISELKHNFETLLTQYPSGLRVQEVLAARHFNCDVDDVVVGNGASELMRPLMSGLKGAVGVTIPTFNEYLSCIPAGAAKMYSPTRADYSYSPDDLIEFSRAQKISALVLINPDNPTGHRIEKKGVQQILRAFEADHRLLILDESFVDFVDGSSAHSFADGDSLQDYPNLIVLKSISKSYGVPGLRLGVMLSKQHDLLRSVRAALPIWNINAIAEGFLQIIGKHKTAFEKACNALSRERERFSAELARIPGITPLPSGANFIFCSLADNLDSTRVATELLEDHWILIKDLKNRIGIGPKNVIRVAVRSAADNDLLLAALQTIAKRREPSSR